jgi:hypothetical protein
VVVSAQSVTLPAPADIRLQPTIKNDNNYTNLP